MCGDKGRGKGDVERNSPFSARNDATVCLPCNFNLSFLVPVVF